MNLSRNNIGLYAGSFDPITRGHLDIISKALNTFNVLYVSIGVNPVKSSRMFSLEESKALIEKSIHEEFDISVLRDANIYITDYAGQSITKYAESIGATHIIRGLRQISDFNDEFNLHGMIERISPNITITHFICESEFLHVSSSSAKLLANLSEDISWLVTPSVEVALKSKQK